MDRTARRESLAAYKEQTRAAGLYAIRCAATAQVWVGRSGDLAAQRNSFGFQMRHGPHNAAMRAAWTAHGAEAFGFEVLEMAPAELTPAGRADFLKRRQAHWREALAAAAV